MGGPPDTVPPERGATEPTGGGPANGIGGLLDTPAAGPAAIRGGAIRVVGYGAGVLLSVVSAALLFRHLGVVDAGRYVTVLSLITVVGGLSEIGLTTIGVREMSVRDHDQQEHFVRNLLGLRIVLTLIGVAGAVLFTVIVGYSAALVAGTALAGLGLLAQTLQGTLSIALLVDLRLGWVTLMELLRQLISTVLIVTFVLLGAGLLPFLAIPIPAGVVILALTAILVRGDMPLTPAFDRAEWRAVLRDTLPVAAGSAVGVIYFRLAIILLSLISTGHQTGYFGAAFRITEALIVVPQLLIGAAFPIFARAARDDHDRLSYGVQRVFEASTILGGALGVALILGAPFAIAVVAGPEFKPAVGVLQVQTLTIVAAFAGSTWVYALVSLHRYREMLLLALGGLVVNSVLVVVLGSVDGARGAAAATTIADVTMALGVAIILTRAAPRLRPSLGILGRAAVAAAVGASVWFVPGVADVVRALLGVLIYGLALLALRAYPPELWVELRRLLGRPA